MTSISSSVFCFLFSFRKKRNSKSEEASQDMISLFAQCGRNLLKYKLKAKFQLPLFVVTQAKPMLKSVDFCLNEDCLTHV